jgi:hypothetical protein
MTEAQARQFKTDLHSITYRKNGSAELARLLTWLSDEVAGLAAGLSEESKYGKEMARDGVNTIRDVLEKIDVLLQD